MQIVTIVVLFLIIMILGYLTYDHNKLLHYVPPFSVAFAPIYEEIIFRGIILSALIKAV